MYENNNNCPHVKRLIDRTIGKMLEEIETSPKPNYPEIIKRRLRLLEKDINTYIIVK